MIIKNKSNIFLIITFFLLSIFGWASFSYAQEKKEIQKQDFGYNFVVDSSQYLSTVEMTSFDFTGVASFWSKDFKYLDLKIRWGEEKNNLGEWEGVENLLLQEDIPDKEGAHNKWNIGEIIHTDNSRFFQYQINFPAQYLNKKLEIKFTIFDATQGDYNFAKVLADSSGLGPKIISRSGWGANESYMTWKPEYSEVKAIVIHHTAGEEKTTIDQLEAVRNLYYGHAVSYGWGDIGYNYVIDINGNIYEGRSGGGSVVGGHTLGYNSGTIGIVLIGDYNVRNVDTPQYNALIDLIAYKLYQNYLDPSGNVYLKNKTIPTIVGHKDLNATSCPGNTLYERISDIRGKVSDKIKTYPEKTFSSQFVSSDSSVKVYGGDKGKLKFSVKNTGNAPWLSDGNNKISIKNSTFDFNASLVNFGRSIEPGETGNFEIEINAPLVNKSGNYNFELIKGGSAIPGTSFSANINIETPPYRAKITSKSAGQNIAPGKQATLSLEVKNIGTNAWSINDEIKLTTKSGQNSFFYTSGNWVDEKTAVKITSNIPSGSSSSFSFLVTAPLAPGQYLEKFVLKSDSQNLEGGEGLEVEWLLVVGENEGELVNVEQKTYSSNLADYAFEVVNQSNYISMLPWETRSAFIEVKNTGKSNWYNDILRLGTSNKNDRNSIFANSTWLASNRISMSQYKIAPGEIVRFDFTLTAPEKLGKYKEYFNFVADSIGWLKDIGIYWEFTVSSPTDDFSYVAQSPYLNLSPGQDTSLWLEVENTGNKVWQKSGSTPVRLATSNPRDRISSFISSNRISMDKDTVNPGEKVRFTFNITAPQEAKAYKEYFTLVRDGVSWFKDIGIYWQITVNPLSDVTINPGNNSGSGQLINNIPSDVETVKISASGPFIVVNGAEAKLAEGGNGDKIEAYYKDGKHYFKVNAEEIKEANGWVRIVPWAPQTILTIDSYEDHPTWNLSLNDNKFKGALEVRYSIKSKKLWVINDLNIEDYLMGVSEPLESAGYEYIKAAVIAERSYIYYHLQRGGRWPDDFITLKNSRKGNGDDQIYQGYNFSLRANNISRAVSETAGQVVAYNGNPVLTPYYTQSDGRTRSISEVWGSSNQANYPWLVSVPDPWSSGYSMLGHGVGMSGRGARGMANEGKKYDEILKYFYTGTGIGKIETNRNVRIGIYSIEL